MGLAQAAVTVYWNIEVKCCAHIGKITKIPMKMQPAAGSQVKTCLDFPQKRLWALFSCRHRGSKHSFYVISSSTSVFFLCLHLSFFCFFCTEVREGAQLRLWFCWLGSALQFWCSFWHKIVFAFKHTQTTSYNRCRAHFGGLSRQRHRHRPLQNHKSLASLIC